MFKKVTLKSGITTFEQCAYFPTSIGRKILTIDAEDTVVDGFFTDIDKIPECLVNSGAISIQGDSILCDNLYAPGRYLIENYKTKHMFLKYKASSIMPNNYSIEVLSDYSKIMYSNENDYYYEEKTNLPAFIADGSYFPEFLMMSKIGFYDGKVLYNEAYGSTVIIPNRTVFICNNYEDYVSGKAVYPDIDIIDTDSKKIKGYYIVMVNNKPFDTRLNLSSYIKEFM